MSGTCPLPPAYQVRGGQNSILVEFDALEIRAGRLEAIAGTLRDIGAGLQRVCGEEAAWNRMQPASAAETARVELDRAVFLLRACIQAAEEAASGLRTAAANYRDAEGRAERLGGLPGLLPAGLAFLDAGPGGFPKLRWVESLPLRLVDTPALLVLAGMLGGRSALREIEVERVRAADGTAETVQVSGTAAGLLERSAVLLREDDPGVVEVLRLETTDGSAGPGQVFVVTIPGTQPGSGAAGDNPFDNYGNAEGRAAESRFVAAAVAEALRQAKAEAGDSVILVGYSQGGIHAANTAGYLRETEGLDVRYVLTAGAPAGDAAIPREVQALHLEHAQDWVPGADGTSNPDALNRVTLTLTGDAPVAGDSGLGPAHKLPVYLEGAEVADGSADPSLRASLAGAGAVVGAGSTASRELYRFRRRERRPALQVVPKAPEPSPAAPRRVPPGRD